MPPSLSTAADKLIAAYQEAALRLERILKAATTPKDRKAALARVNSLLSELEALSADYIQQEIPLQYKEGSQEAIRELQKVRGLVVDDTFTATHREALQALADDARLKFASSIQSVRNGVAAKFRAADRQQIMTKLITSEIEGDALPQKQVKILLEQSGVTGVQTRRGTIALEDYASMLTHTVLAEAHNTGAANRYISNGVQYGEVIERGDAPDYVCQWMRGKIVWLGDRRLINPFHPRCYGGIKPFFGDTSKAIKSPEDPRIPAEVKKAMLRK